MTIADFFILIKNPDVGCIDHIYGCVSGASEKITIVDDGDGQDRSQNTAGPSCSDG